MNVFRELEVESNELILIPTFYVPSSSSLDEPGKLYSKIATWRAEIKFANFSFFLRYFLFLISSIPYSAISRCFQTQNLLFIFNLFPFQWIQYLKAEVYLERWWNVNKNLYTLSANFSENSRKAHILFTQLKSFCIIYKPSLYLDELTFLSGWTNSEALCVQHVNNFNTSAHHN